MNTRALRREAAARNFENASHRSASSSAQVVDASRFDGQTAMISGQLLGQSLLRAPGFAGVFASNLRIKSPAEVFA